MNVANSTAFDTRIFHPLDPLSAAELEAAADIVRKHMGGADLRFETIELKEPAKTAVRAFANDGTKPRREARVNVFRPGRIGVWRFVVSLSDRTVSREEHLPEARPMIMLEEFMSIEDTVKADPGFIAACAKRGITDMDLVCVDPWSAGNFDVEGEEGKHLAHTFCWVRMRPDDNLYAHPIEGLNPVVDIKTMTVVRVDDYGAVPVPEMEVNYDAQFIDETREDLRPIDVIQPDGVTFWMEGRTIKWHDWAILIGFNGREGLTLHDIRYADRPILYRASIAEMVVPYGSPDSQHARKNVFDIGEYGLGKLANSLELGCDCLGVIHYLDADISGIEGKAETIKNAICIHEEDTGILWKHWDFRTDKTEVRRGRRLVISSISTVGNYEYASYWYFYLDGKIEFEMKATGIINTVGKTPETDMRFGTEVAPGVIGQIHQHLFVARLDLSVDGDRNCVMECNTKALPMGPENPYGNAFFVEETRLDKECGRTIAPETQRYWKFASAEKTNYMGQPTAYKLEPTHAVTPFNHPEGPSGQRMPFIYNHLWLTEFHPEERYPAGDFMNHSDGSEGVHKAAERGHSIDGADVVAWHVFGLHHNVRLEDFPVQPVISTGFMLMPNGFFDGNPCLDLPAERNVASCCAAG
ncbi:MAG: tyramine oxidase [Rhodobacteraceae bacterium]|nr:tyramine oxidase [Paracoccaceae bacterium]MAY44139.1 tyramine oxidase [Paracoccaceae bacterium]